MHLQAAILFAQETGKFFALTALDLLNWITPWRHDIKMLKISAMDLETMLILCISIKKSPDLVKLSLKEKSEPLWWGIQYIYYLKFARYVQYGQYIRWAEGLLEIAKNYVLRLYVTAPEGRKIPNPPPPTLCSAVIYIGLLFTGVHTSTSPFSQIYHIMT